MTRFTTTLFTASLFFALPATRAQTDQATADAKRLALLKTQLAELENQWQNDQNTMLRRIAALEERRDSLNDTIDDLRVNNEKLATQKQTLENTRKHLKSLHDTVANVIDHEHKRLIHTLTPPVDACALLGTLDHNTLHPPRSTNIANRLADFADLAVDTCRFATAFHAGSVTLDVPNLGRRQLDTLLTGTIIAFAVAPDDSIAAVGLRTGDDWTWHWNSDAAPLVRHAFNIAQGSRPPAIIRLPFPARHMDTVREEHLEP